MIFLHIQHTFMFPLQIALFQLLPGGDGVLSDSLAACNPVATCQHATNLIRLHNWLVLIHIHTVIGPLRLLHAHSTRGCFHGECVLCVFIDFISFDEFLFFFSSFCFIRSSLTDVVHFCSFCFYPGQFGEIFSLTLAESWKIRRLPGVTVKLIRFCFQPSSPSPGCSFIQYI